MSLFGGKDLLKDGNNDQADYDGGGQYSFHQENFYANETSYQQQQQQQQQNGFGFPGYSGHSINQLPSTQRSTMGGGALSQSQQPPQMFRGLSSTTVNMLGGIGGQGQPVTDHNVHFLSAGGQRSSSISSTANGQQQQSTQSHLLLGSRFGSGGGSDHLSSDSSSLIGDNNSTNDNNINNNDFSSFGLGGGSAVNNNESGLFGSAGSSAGRTPTSGGLFAPVGSTSAIGTMSTTTIGGIGSSIDTSSLVGSAPPGVQLPPAAAPSAIQPPQPQQVQLTNREKEVKFGLLGLLSDVIKCPDKDSQSLALGTDLTAFGLNLSAAENLYPSFTSPFTENMVEEKDRAYKTPSCYLMHPPVMKSEHIAKFQVETLFYMFYQMPRDILQAFAAQELHRREWRYQGELKIWIKQRSPQDMVSSHPQVPFVYFDPKAWETRLFDAKNRPGLAAGILSEEDVRVKNVSSTAVGGTGGMGAIGSAPGAIGATLQGGGGSVSAVQQVPPDIS